MKLIFTGGGTGGHVNPAVAMAVEAKTRFDCCDILFIGRTGGSENRAAISAGLGIETLEVSGISRSLSLKNLSSIAKALRAEHSARKIIRNFAPDAVIGTGGYVCWPVLHAAKRLGFPTLIHESNAYPGLVTRLLSPGCDRVLLNNIATANHLRRQDNVIEVGNPLRRGFSNLSRAAARRHLGLSERDIFVLSFGGSLGAKVLNDACIGVMRNYCLRKSHVKHLHACGERYFDSYRGTELAVGRDGCKILPYVDNMPSILPAADIAICRCGAMTLSEIALAKVPAILIPSPNVTDNHQYKNGKLFSDGGGAIMITEKELSAGLLEEQLRGLADSPQRRRQMSISIGKFAKADATRLCIDEIEAVIGGSD